MVEVWHCRMGIRNVAKNIRGINIRVCCEFSLQGDGWRPSDTGEQAHLEDVTNPIEIYLPGSNCLLLVLYAEGSGEYAPFTSLSDTPLDLFHGALIKNMVGKSSDTCSTSPTHVVRCSIVSKIGEPDWGTPLPLIPLSRD